MQTLQNKLNELAQNGFSEQACFEFFGKLNESEIKLMLHNLQANNFSFISDPQREFMIKYFEQLLAKIEEVKKASLNNQGE